MISSLPFLPFAVQSASSLPWWLWLILIIIFLLLVWFLISLFGKKETPPAKVEKMAEAPVVDETLKANIAVQIPEKMAEIPMTPPAPDDLKIIEGIGPKIAGLLQAAGITTFDQLAKTEVTRLKEILQAANLQQLADPATWAGQARLAADGKWDELQGLQDQLKGGKKVNS